MNKARIIEEHKTNYVILDGAKDFIATVRGTFFADESFPKVGDFVTYEEVAEGKAVIEEVLPRTSTIVRKAVETGDEQVMVTNVDVIFIVMGLDGDFNISRLERYLLLAKQSNVEAVLILNKSDVVDDIEEYINKVKEVTEDIPVYAISATKAENMEVLFTHLGPEVTAVLLGSSGAGKSTITNWLLQEDTQSVNEVREDDSRGKHTTTSRQLFALPNGGYLIDTPGMRELGVQSTEDDEEAVFVEIEILSNQCRFSNCDHDKSDGCAVLQAIADDVISVRQLQNYQKIKRERLYEESKHDTSSARDNKQKQKNLRRNHKETQKENRSGNIFD